MSEPAASPLAAIESWEVLDLLTSLVQKSGVVYEEDEQGQGRYRLLEPMRQYARDRLQEAEEAEGVRDRHRDWFVALAERAGPHLQGPQQRAWKQHLEREHDNLRAALARCLEAEDGVEAGLRAAGALTWFWIKQGHLADGWQCLTGLLAIGSGAPVAIRGKALFGAMMVARSRIDFAALEALAEEGLALGREAEDKWLTAVSLGVLASRALHGRTAVYGHDPEWAQALSEEGLVLAREVGDPWLTAQLLAAVATVAEYRGDDRRARTLNQEAQELYRGLGDIGGIAGQLGNLASLAQREGNDDQAKALWGEALVLYREMGDRSRPIIVALQELADLALDQSDLDTARTYFEESLAVARGLDLRFRMASALIGLARVALARGDRQAVRALLEEAHTVDPDEDTCVRVGKLLLELGDYAAARSRYEEGLALRRQGGNTFFIAWALVEVGHAAWLQGAHSVTRVNAVEALGLFQERGDNEGILAALESLAVAAWAPEPDARDAGGDRAARLLGAVEALREALKLPGPTFWLRPRERIGEAVRAASLEQAFGAAWAEGRALTLEEAIQYALAESEPS